MAEPDGKLSIRITRKGLEIGWQDNRKVKAAILAQSQKLTETLLDNPFGEFLP
jgi:hypothetical protein